MHAMSVHTVLQTCLEAELPSVITEHVNSGTCIPRIRLLCVLRVLGQGFLLGSFQNETLQRR